MLVRDLLAIIGRLAPPGLAADWDNCGLQIGSSNGPVTKIGVSLDATLPTVAKAITSGCDVLLTHHPLLFKPLKCIDFSKGPGLIVHRALADGLTIISAHTNWDAAKGGVATALAQVLGLTDCAPLEPAASKACKLVTFVPTGLDSDYENKVRQALFAAGAGVLGGYERCWFASPGQGGFKALPQAQPFIGKPGQEAVVSEIRLEVICPQAMAHGVVEALRASHPYEEPAFELHTVEIYNQGEGLGLVGQWVPPQNLFEKLKGFGTPYKWAGPQPQKLIRRVALLPGSGGDYLALAKNCGAEVFITGDTSYHQALGAHDLGLTLVDLGHYESEWPGVVLLAQTLRYEMERCNQKVECLVLPQAPAWNYSQQTPLEAR